MLLQVHQYKLSSIHHPSPVKLLLLPLYFLPNIEYQPHLTCKPSIYNQFIPLNGLHRFILNQTQPHQANVHRKFPSRSTCIPRTQREPHRSRPRSPSPTSTTTCSPHPNPIRPTESPRQLLACVLKQVQNAVRAAADGADTADARGAEGRLHAQPGLIMCVLTNDINKLQIGLVGGRGQGTGHRWEHGMG
jgi:hypothetical protein